MNCGLSDKNEVLKYYIFERDVLSTFSKENADELISLGYKVLGIKEIECFTLLQIVEKYAKNKNIDILSIDTEGFDYKILNSNNWTKYRPQVIITESNSDEISNLLYCERDKFPHLITELS